MKSFQSFRLDTENHLLLHGGERVSLTPKAFDVLRYLVERAGRLVTQDELLESLWTETYVNQEVLRKYILEIRKALGDKPDNPEFIETITKRGYRFIAPVTEEDPAAAPILPNSDFGKDILHGDLKRISPDTTSGKVEAPTRRARKSTLQWAAAVILVILVGAV